MRTYLLQQQNSLLRCDKKIIIRGDSLNSVISSKSSITVYSEI